MYLALELNEAPVLGVGTVVDVKLELFFELNDGGTEDKLELFFDDRVTLLPTESGWW